MRLLIDSQALIWYVDQDQFLSPAAHAAITDPNSDLVLSAAAVGEIAIKVGLGKLSLSLPYRQWMTKAIADLGASILPITVDYADAQSALPQHHRDPFDRLMVAQAQLEKVSVVSADPAFDLCGVTRVW
jgi:PIN domain nuclease of toxin-antitoxin system